MDNVFGLLIAVFGGAVASLIAGWAARPRTKAEAKKENATADVSMSGDAREWATFWADKAKAAELRAESAETNEAAADARVRVVEDDRRNLVYYARILESMLTGNKIPLPKIAERLRALIDKPDDH